MHDQRLLADAHDGRLEQVDFLSAALIASGINNPTELAEARRQYVALAKDVQADALRHLPPAEKAGELHARLHAEVLVGDYQRDASDVRVAIRSGNYNCLSAVALFWHLSQEAELDVRIVSQPGHVYLVNAASGERIEPASPNWTPDWNEKRYSRSPCTPRRITPIQLLGKFYYNRGVLLLQQGGYAEGLALIKTSLALDPDDREAQGNLVAGLNNWAVALGREKRFAEARELIEQGLVVDRNFQPLVANLRYVQHQVGW